jgi:hypothetical protein
MGTYRWWLATAFLFWAAGSGRGDEARAIVDRAIRAHGGAANIDRFHASLTHTMGTIAANGGTISFTQEIRLERPGRLRQLLSLRSGDGKETAAFTTVYNGRKGWLKQNGTTQELGDRELEETRETAYLAELTRLTCLTDSAFELAVLADTVVGGRRAVGVRVIRRGYRDVDLFFDAQSGLLLKTRRRAVWKGTEFVEERLLSDYREVQGIKSAKKVEVSRGGERFMTAEILDVQYLEAFGDNIFERP